MWDYKKHCACNNQISLNYTQVLFSEACLREHNPSAQLAFLATTTEKQKYILFSCTYKKTNNLLLKTPGQST